MLVLLALIWLIYLLHELHLMGVVVVALLGLGIRVLFVLDSEDLCLLCSLGGWEVLSTWSLLQVGN